MKINWPEITGTLRMHYGSLAKASKSTGVCAEQIRKLDRGEIKNPRFTTGMLILQELRKIDLVKFERITGEFYC